MSGDRRCGGARGWLVLSALLVVGAPPRGVAAQAPALAPAALRFGSATSSGRLGEIGRGPAPLVRVDPRAPRPQEATDRWFGADKIRHFGASAAIQIMAFGVLRSAGAAQGPAHVGASLVTTAVGIGKELHDRRVGRVVSGKDLVWDGIGLLAGSGLAQLVDLR